MKDQLGGMGASGAESQEEEQRARVRVIGSTTASGTVFFKKEQHMSLLGGYLNPSEVEQSEEGALKHTEKSWGFWSEVPKLSFLALEHNNFSVPWFPCKNRCYFMRLLVYIYKFMNAHTHIHTIPKAFSLCVSFQSLLGLACTHKSKYLHGF